MRHREESKNVNRLTMENMNLASRCREAIGQASRLKKEVARLKRESLGDSPIQPQQQTLQQQQQRTSTLLAPSQSFASEDGTRNSNNNPDEDDVITPVNSPMPFSINNKSTSIPPLMAPIPTDDQSDALLSPNNLDNASSYTTSLSHKAPDMPIAPLRKPSMDQEEQSPPHQHSQNGKTADLARELGKMDQRLKSQLDDKNTNNKDTREPVASTPVDVDDFVDTVLLSPSQPEESIDEAFFPTSASPRIGISHSGKKAVGNYNEGFPDDMLSVDRRTTRKRIAPLQGFSELDDDDSTLGSGALQGAFGEAVLSSSNNSNRDSIDAFEASFQTSFPESFSPQAKRSVTALSSTTVIPQPPGIKSQSTSDLYNPFTSSPQSEGKEAVPLMDPAAFRNSTSPGSSPVAKPPPPFMESNKLDRDDTKISLTTSEAVTESNSATPGRSNVKPKIASDSEVTTCMPQNSSPGKAITDSNLRPHKDPPGKNRTSTRIHASSSNPTKVSGVAGAFSPALQSSANVDNRPTVYLSTNGVSAAKKDVPSYSKTQPSRSKSSTTLSANNNVFPVRNQLDHSRTATKSNGSTLADSLVVTRNTNGSKKDVMSRSISAPRSFAHSSPPGNSSMSRRNSVDRVRDTTAKDDSHSDSLGYDSARARFERAVQDRKTESDKMKSSSERGSRLSSHRTLSSPGDKPESASRRRSRDFLSFGGRKSSYESSSGSGDEKFDGQYKQPTGRFSPPGDKKQGSKKLFGSRRSLGSTEDRSYRGNSSFISSPGKVSPLQIDKSVSRVDAPENDSKVSQRGRSIHRDREPMDRTYKLNSPSIVPRRESVFEEKKTEGDNDSVLSVKDRVTLFSIGTDSLPKSPELEQRRMSVLTSPGRNKTRVGVVNGRTGSALVDDGDIPLVSNLRVSTPPPSSSVALKARLWGEEEVLD